MIHRTMLPKTAGAVAALEEDLARLSYELGQAVVLLRKAAAVPEKSNSLVGRLEASSSGWILLRVPNGLVRGAFDALDEAGVELPTDQENRLNAHISVFSPADVAAIGGVDAISERGKPFHYRVTGTSTVVPTSYPGIGRVWMLDVESSELKELRRSYGLSPIPHDGQFPFHITFALRRRKVLQTGETRKESADKPADCACRYPQVRLRNGSGHDFECPVHKAWEAAGGFDRNKAAFEREICDREDCPHCGALMERGDNGNCNRCMKPWPAKTKTAGLKAEIRTRYRAEHDAVCPHCGDVIGEKGLFRDDDGWHHRGPCVDKPGFEIDWPKTAAETDEAAEQLARFFHDTYERLAPNYGYETRKDTRAFDPGTTNGKLMIAVCGEVLKKMGPVDSLDMAERKIGRELNDETVVIDRPKGYRKTFGTPDGPKRVTYPVDYGYFKGFNNPDDDEDADVFIGSGGPLFGRFMKGDNLSGSWKTDERKWYYGCTEQELDAIRKMYDDADGVRYADGKLLRDWIQFASGEDLVADLPGKEPANDNASG